MQGAKDLKVNKIAATADSLILEIVSMNGKFEGKFETDSIISGTWRQSGMNFPLSLKKSVTVSKLQRPQTPQPPFSYISENVEYRNAKSKLKIADTLTIPKNTVNSPVVILISCSGEQILYKQNDLVLKAAGMNENVINQNRKLQEAIFDILLNEKDSVKQTDRLQHTYTGGMYQAMNNEQKKAID